MIALLAALARILGPAASVFLVMLLYYEGLPGFARIPYLSSIPVLGDLTVGRVNVVASVAKDAGKTEERLAWEELRRRALLKAEQDRQKAQDEINAADRTVAALKVQGRLRAAAFEAAMKEQKDEDAKSGVDRACGTLPDRMWRALSD